MTEEELRARFKEIQDALELRGFTFIGSRNAGGLLRASAGLPDTEIIGNLIVTIEDLKQAHLERVWDSVLDEVQKSSPADGGGDPPKVPG